MPFAAAISTHPVTAIATGEVTGQILETLGAYPDLVCCFVTSSHAGALEDVAATVRAVLSPTALIGCASDWILGNSTEVTARAGIALWAGLTGPVTPFWIPGGERSSGPEFLAIGDPAFTPSGLVVLADPFSFPVDRWLESVAAQRPGLPVAGGLIAATGPSRPPMLIDDRIVTDGAVGAVIGPGTEFAAVVAQGCRLIGRPLVVTAAERNVIYELAGAPAFSRLLEIAHDQMPAEELHLINEGLHLGIAPHSAGTGEPGTELGIRDLLMRPVHGVDPANGAIAIGVTVDTGTVVQFSVRDEQAAVADLHEVLAGRQADGALLFSCTGRGRGMFSQANHDVEAAGEELGFPPLAGLFAAGEIGPVGLETGGHSLRPGAQRPHVHTQSAAFALFTDRY